MGNDYSILGIYRVQGSGGYGGVEGKFKLLGGSRCVS